MITTKKIRDIAAACPGSRQATLNWLADMLDADESNEAKREAVKGTRDATKVLGKVAGE